MTSKTVAAVGSGMAMGLAMLWLLLACLPMTWISSQSVVVNFKASLLTVTAKKGTVAGILAVGASLVGAGKVTRSLDKLFDKSLWLEEGTQEFCGAGLELLFRWCNNWTMVKFSSWAMVFCSVITAALLALGGCFMYYYAHSHATHTGRMWVRACYSVAPVTALAGLLQYATFTMDFGHGSNMGPEPTSMYEGGFIMACALCLLSWLPLYTHAVFSKQAEDEKHGDGEEPEAAACGTPGGAYGSGYGATEPGGAYGSAQGGYAAGWPGAYGPAPGAYGPAPGAPGGYPPSTLGPQPQYAPTPPPPPPAQVPAVGAPTA